ncbi:golgin subfamily A member 4 isoform X2 [Brachionus plicatilis]|uniref:Golgin subfamily A member 4 isoform X2 n=1 Tax=Brachionus plicatilis TaxID=10195 RepID=A0A3M7QM90_BRAPC|nr:golgin subfamily A member 4 isoform X2 [Brachionus plicatilis]
MFKKLKSQIKDSVSPVLTSGTNYLSNTIETMSNSGRTRRDSHSSVASDATGFLFTNYTSPSRSYYPPSDIESEVESESGDRLNKLLDIYKNKYAQLKNAFAESEAEKEKIKKILTDSQDRVLKRVQELRDQVECEKTDKAHLELKLAEKDRMIESLKNQEESSPPHGNLIDLESIDDNESKEKMEKLQILLVKCRKLIENQKQDLIKKDDLISEQKVEIEKLKPLVEEKDELKARFESLQAQIDKMKSDFESREVNFNEERSVLQQNLEKSNKRCNDLSMELEEKGNLFQKQFQLFQVEFNEKEENLAYRLKLLQQDYNNLEQELISEKANKTKAESEKEINDKVERISNEKKEMENHYENLIKDLNVKIVKYDDDIAKLESAIVGKDKELNNFKLKEENNVNLDELNKTLESKDKEITNLKNTHEKLDTSQSEVNNLKSENDTLSKELAHRDKRIEELIEKINQSELSLNDLGKKIQEKNTEMESMKKSMLEKEQNILNENQMLRTNIDQLNDQHKQSIELIENLKKEKTELEKRTSEKLSENEKSSSAEIERLKKELNRIESEKLTTEQTIEALEKEKKHFEDSKLEMERLIGVKDEEENKIFLTKKVDELNTELNHQFQKAHSDLSETHKNELDFLNRQIGELKAELEEEKKNRADLNNQLNDSKSNEAILKLKTIKTNSQIKELNAQLEKCELEKNRVFKEFEQNNRKYTELIQEIENEFEIQLKTKSDAIVLKFLYNSLEHFFKRIYHFILRKKI